MLMLPPDPFPEFDCSDLFADPRTHFLKSQDLMCTQSLALVEPNGGCVRNS